MKTNSNPFQNLICNLNDLFDLIKINYVVLCIHLYHGNLNNQHRFIWTNFNEWLLPGGVGDTLLCLGLCPFKNGDWIGDESYKENY